MAGIAGAKCRIFNNPVELAAFLAASVTTVISIVSDNSGKYILFYT